MDMNYTPSVANALATIGIPLWRKTAADSLATDAASEFSAGALGPGGAAAQGFPVGYCSFTPDAALTADSVNYATITVAKRTAGGAATTIASATTKLAAAGGTGNWTQWKPVSIPVIAGALLAPGDAITVSVTKSGTGVIVPAGRLDIYPAAR